MTLRSGQDLQKKTSPQPCLKFQEEDACRVCDAAKRFSGWTRSRPGEDRERRWPACPAYSAEVALATKAGNAGTGMADPSVRLRACFFNIPIGEKRITPALRGIQNLHYEAYA